MGVRLVFSDHVVKLSAAILATDRSKNGRRSVLKKKLNRERRVEGQWVLTTNGRTPMIVLLEQTKKE